MTKTKPSKFKCNIDYKIIDLKSLLGSGGIPPEPKSHYLGPRVYPRTLKVIKILLQIQEEKWFSKNKKQYVI